MRLPPPKFLLIQFGRLGDLAQSLPLVDRLHALHPRAEIFIACQEASARVWAKIPLPVKFLTLSTQAMQRLSRLRKEDETDRNRWYQEFPVLKESFRMVLNLSADFESAAFVGLIRQGVLRGRGPAPEGRISARGKSARYFFSAALRRKENPIHWVDWQMSLADLYPGTWVPNPIYRRQFEASRPVKDDASAENELKVYRIAVQLGASDRQRALDPESVAQALHLAFASERILPVRLGDASESDLGLRFEKTYRGFRPLALDKSASETMIPKNLTSKKMALKKSNLDGSSSVKQALEKPTPDDWNNRDELINRIGQTSLEEIPAALLDCDFLISNDTGTLHIAAYLGLKSLSWFFATAFHRETAPYGDGHYVLQADLPCSPCSVFKRCETQECRKAFQPSLMAKALLAAKNGDQNGLGVTPGLQFLTSRFHPQGFFEYRSLPAFEKENGTDLEPLWRQFLHRNFPTESSLKGFDERDKAIQPHQKQALRATREIAEYGLSLSRQAFSLLPPLNPSPNLLPSPASLDPRVETYFEELSHFPEKIELAAAAWPLWRDICLFQWEDPAWDGGEVALYQDPTVPHSLAFLERLNRLKSLAQHQEALFLRILVEAEGLER
jgi:ADP-heptose:LPS heptosyltransferase